MSLTAGRRPLLVLEVPLGALGAALVACAGAFAAAGMPPLPPALLVRFGIPSPLSGMTRSFVALAGGDVGAAFAWHPLGPIAFAACAGAALVAVVSWVRGRRLEIPARLLRHRPVWAGVTAAFLSAWVRQVVVLG